jgi:multidrug efflux pump subunit AcrA (membrane-fusion protein)
MTVTLDDQHAGGDLDRAPVQVRLTTASRPGVLAVPVTALLALAEGGYGVETIQPDGLHRVLAVTTGLFADTMVEVNGNGITEGVTVVTAR